MTLEARLARLENSAVVATNAAIAKDAAAFRANVIATAQRFDDADQFIPALERSERFSRAMELAWVMRFGTDAEFAGAMEAMKRYATEAMQ